MNKADNEKISIFHEERENFPQTSMKTPYFHKKQTLHKINFVKI